MESKYARPNCVTIEGMPRAYLDCHKMSADTQALVEKEVQELLGIDKPLVCKKTWDGSGKVAVWDGLHHLGFYETEHSHLL